MDTPTPRSPRYPAACWLALLAAACPAIAGADMPFPVTEYSWSAGDGDKALGDSDKRLCVLTGIAGKFAGGGEQVRLTTRKVADTDAHVFILTGQSGQAQLRSFAACAPRNRFIGDALTQSLGWTLTATQCATGAPAKPGQFTASATSFLGVVGGALRGRGELVAAALDRGPKGIRISGCSGNVSGAVQTLLSPAGRPILYRTRDGWTNDPDTGAFEVEFLHNSAFNELHHTWWHPNGQRVTGDGWLIPVAQGLCGLVEVQGKFNGYGERVQVTPAVRNGQAWWRLEATTQSEDGYVRARVRCLARDQTRA